MTVAHRQRLLPAPPALAADFDERSRVRRQLAAQRHQLQAPDPLAMRRIEAAGDDEYRAGHGPDIRQFAENQEAENRDPQQLGVGKRRQHGSVGIAEGQHDDPAVEATPMKTPKAISCQLGATHTNGTSAEMTQTPTIDE